MFSIDGVTWPYPCDIDREVEIKVSDISGLKLDKSYFRDVLGTYMQYTVKITVPYGDKGRYFSLYDILTEPVDGHQFILPHDNNTISVTGIVDNLTDIYVRMPNGQTFWKGIRFNITSNHPTKTVTLGEAIARGTAPLPTVNMPVIGDAYIYTANGWVANGTYNDADNTGY